MPKTIQLEMYVADDGMIFDSYDEAFKYEVEKNYKKVFENDEFQLFDKNENLIDIFSEEVCNAYYIRAKSLDAYHLLEAIGKKNGVFFPNSKSYISDSNMMANCWYYDDEKDIWCDAYKYQKEAESMLRRLGDIFVLGF